MSTPCPPIQNNHIFLVTVTVTEEAGKPQICYAPETITVDQSTSLIVFQLQTAGWAFPDDGSAVRVAGTDPVTKVNAAKQFPTAWISPNVLALQDHNNCSTQPCCNYSCTVSIVHTSTGQRLSKDPAIQNDTQG